MPNAAVAPRPFATRVLDGLPWLGFLFALTPLLFAPTTLDRQLRFWREAPGLDAAVLPPLAPPHWPVFALVALAMALLAWRTRRRRDLVLCALPLLAAGIDAGADPLSAARWHVLYVLVAGAGLVLFARYARLRSWYVALFALALLASAEAPLRRCAGAAEAGGACAAPAPVPVRSQVAIYGGIVLHIPADSTPRAVDTPDADVGAPLLPALALTRFFAEARFSVFDALAALMALLALRAAALIVLQNAAFVRSLDAATLRATLLHGLWLWILVPAVFVACTAFWWAAWARAEAGAVAAIVAGVDAPPDCATRTGEPRLPALVADGLDLELALAGASDRQAEFLRRCLVFQVRRSGLSASRAADRGVDTVAPAIRAGFPLRLPGTETEECRWYALGCQLRNALKASANAAYAKGRDATMHEVDAQFVRWQREIAEHRRGAETSIADFAAASADRASARTRAGLAKLFGGLFLAANLFTLYTFLVLCKTFLMVCSRLLFRLEAVPGGGPVAGRVATVHGQERGAGAQRIEAFAGDYPLPADDWLIVANVGLNVPYRKRYRYLLAAVVRRLLAGTYAFHRVPAAEIAAAQARADPAKAALGDHTGRLVAWTLAADDAVYFDFRHLVGMSESVRISVEYSFRLSSLIFGRVRFFRADGPGRLLLRTHGTAAVGRARVLSDATNVIAWHARERFRVGASLNPWDTVASEHHLESEDGAHVVDLAAQETGRSTSLLRFFRTFVLPF